RLLEIGGAVKLYGLGPIESGIDQDDPSVGCLEDPEHHGEVDLPLAVGTLDQGGNRAASHHGVSDGINFVDLRLVSAGVILAQSPETSHEDDRPGVVARHEKLR